METNTFASIFYLRSSRLDKNGKAGIYFRITVNGKRAEISIQRKTNPEKWCSAKGRIKGSSKDAKELNHYMDQLESKAYEFHSKLVVKKKPFNAETIKNKLLGKGTAHKTLLAIYDEQCPNQRVDRI
nr:Arm DNA-binding domain-containing protein [Allomuricauda sp.]